MMTDINESILMSIPMLDSVFPQLTNQQFINCAFLERPPSSLFCPVFYRTALIPLIGDSLTKEEQLRRAGDGTGHGGSMSAHHGTPSLVSSSLFLLPYSAKPNDPCFSKSQDERLARWCFYSTLL